MISYCMHIEKLGFRPYTWRVPSPRSRIVLVRPTLVASTRGSCRESLNKRYVEYHTTIQPY